MMLRDNEDRVLAETRHLRRVLDVGGSAIPLETATHIIDLIAPSKNGATFIQRDICKKPWPFHDGYFDYAVCSHTLEDIRDPIGACEELMRVAKRGYIEVPSRLREIFHHKPFMRLRAMLGRPSRMGYGHHRWFCERDGNGLVFIAKTSTAIQPRYALTRLSFGRELTPEEAFLGFFWEGHFNVSERIFIKPGETEAELQAFKTNALRPR
jgi:hypothetical protein